jgi:hypothetical protein
VRGVGLARFRPLYILSQWTRPWTLQILNYYIFALTTYEGVKYLIGAESVRAGRCSSNYGD